MQPDIDLEKGKLYYLASPYSHEYAEVRVERFESACKAAGDLIRQGYEVFSPVAHSHPVAFYGGVDAMDGKRWLELDLEILARCDGLIVYLLPGWEKSRGMAQEIDFAASVGMPIHNLRE